MQFFYNLFKKSSVPEVKNYAYKPYLSVASHAGRAIWSRVDYMNICTEGYRMNPIVYACIRMTAEGAARIPFKIYHNGKVIDTHPVITLLKNPNPWSSGRSLKADLFGYLQIAGNAYLDCISLGKDYTIPQELYALRPDRVQVMTDDNGHASGFAYKPSEGKTTYLTGDLKGRILHLKYFSPDNDYYGQPPLEAAMRATDIHNEAGNFQKSLLDNAARPSGCLIYSGLPGSPNLTENQFNRLKSELEEHYTGSAHAGRPMVLEGGLDWKPMSFSPSDMEFSTLRHSAAREIALAFGVPPMMLAIPGDNTYSNYQEAVRVFTRNTLIPLAEILTEALSRKFSALYHEDLDIQLDTDSLPAFLPEMEARRKFISEASFLSDTEKRELLF